MKYAYCMKTVMGGLSLVLVLSACSSGSKSKTTTSPPSGEMSRTAPPSGDTSKAAGTISPPSDLPRSDVVSDRGTTRGKTYDSTTRTGLSDRSPEIAAACPSKVDADGKIVFDDPTCPDRYRRQAGTTAAGGAAGLAAACASKSDANGKVIYDDPACPDRYRQQNASMNAIREARVRLSRAAGIKTWDSQPGDKLARPDPVGVGGARPDPVGVGGDCPSKVDAKGNVIYADSGCAHRYYYQTKENAYYDRYADKAAKHARAAEIAAIQGNMPDMIQNAEQSLDHAKEARRSGNNPDLAAGIAALRQSIALGQSYEVTRSTSSPTSTATAAATPRTLKGELSQKKDATRADGGESYVLRDRENREMPITLSPEMSRQVQVGDVVEAQVDSNGQVTSITKAQ
ncbi:MAG TPA: small metal-binding protein SmbP [Nitrospira sp.]